MPIETSPGFKTSGGQWFPDIAAARKHELALLLGVTGEAETDAVDRSLIESIVDHAEAVISILRATGRKPRAKKPKLGRPRKVKSVAANGSEGVPA